MKLVFLASALEMGLSNVKRIFLFGFPRDVEESVQEVGRGGRDGKTFEALIIYQSFRLAVCETDVKAYVKKPSNECRRNLLCSPLR